MSDSTPDTTLDGEAPDARTNEADSYAAASKQWRSLWRLHFYAGIFAVPFIILMALTGLVILYTQPIQDALQGDLRTVEEGGKYLSYDVQSAAAEKAARGAPLVSMIPPTDRGRSTEFWAAEDDESTTAIFVNPYTAKVLGTTDAGGGIVGLANRLHGYLNLDSINVSLPTVSALWDGDAVMRPYVLGDLVLELLGVWTLVLVMSGLYLWWPRRSRSGGTERTGRGFFTLRWSKGGRARWRDVHGLAGVFGMVLMVMTLLSGFVWSTYWGANFSSLANKVTPNAEAPAPNSVSATRGDLDRLGNKIHWNTGNLSIPASYAPADEQSAAPLSLDAVVAIAKQEKMLSGYSVNFPSNSEDEAGNPVYGTFTLSNSWPRATGEARDVYLDQFSGKHLGKFTGWGYGTVSYAADVVVETHMGAQLGILSRILMTALCVFSITSVVSATVMYSKRRRPGTLGLPRRPTNVALAPRLGFMALGLGIVFPQWAASALIILGLDRFVIRKVPRLRHTFGQA